MVPRNTTVIDKKLTKSCTKCTKEKNVSKEFYVSYSKIHSDGRVPVCKTCLENMFNKDNVEGSLKEILRMIDKPYVYHLVESSMMGSIDTIFKMYMKNCVMKQYKGMTWKDSIFESKSFSQENLIPIDKNVPIINIQNEFQLTDDLFDKWGDGYTPEHYRLFEKKYSKLIRNYGEKTELHKEGLLVYIRFRVQEEMASARGDVKEAKEWAALATKASQDAKINVSQLSKSDISGGVDVLAQLFEAAETEASIIPLLPKLLEQPYDDADMVIWANINYYRSLEDKPRVSYREIWNFYDEMLSDYYNQQGLDENEVEEQKAKRNNVFRDLGEIYIEPLYNDSGE